MKQFIGNGEIYELMGRNYCVYEHVNKINGKKYIGMTKDPKHRWRSDGYEYRRCTHFWSAIQKYGWDNFEHTVLRKELTHMEACELEIKLIAEQETIEKGYNLASGGNGGRVYQEHPRGMLGKPQTEHQKQVLKEYMSNPETNPMMNGTTVFGKTLPHPLSKNVQVTDNKGDVERFFTIKECADYFGFSKEGMRRIVMKNKPYKGSKTELHGYVFEFLPKGSVEFKPKEGSELNGQNIRN